MSKVPSLPDKMWAWVDSSLRPLDTFYLWCKTVDSRIRAGDEGLAGIRALTLDDDWTDFIQIVVNGTVSIKISSPYSGSISSVITDCDSGTCTLTVSINGTPLGGDPNSVSTSESTEAHSSDNEFAVGDEITYAITSNASCTKLRVQINYTRPLVEA